MEIKWSQERMKGNNSIVEEKVANMTSLQPEKENNSFPISLVLSSGNHLPFSLVLFAFLEALCSLLHSRLFSG